MSDPLRVANEIKATILTPTAEKADGAATGAVERSKVLMDIAPVQGFLGVHQPTPDQMQQIQYLKDFFTDGESNLDAADLLSRIKATERKLAPPTISETRLGKIYAYVKALKQVRAASKVAEAYEG